MPEFKFGTCVAPSVERHLGLVELVQVVIKCLDILTDHQDLFHAVADVLYDVSARIMCDVRETRTFSMASKAFAFA